MTDTSFCKDSKCELDPETCGKISSDCMLNEMKRSIDSLLSIGKSFGIITNSTISSKTIGRIEKVKRIVDTIMGVK